MYQQVQVLEREIIEVEAPPSEPPSDGPPGKGGGKYTWLLLFGGIGGLGFCSCSLLLSFSSQEWYNFFVSFFESFKWQVAITALILSVYWAVIRALLIASFSRLLRSRGLNELADLASSLRETVKNNLELVSLVALPIACSLGWITLSVLTNSPLDIPGFIKAMLTNLAADGLWHLARERKVRHSSDQDATSSMGAIQVLSLLVILVPIAAFKPLVGYIGSDQETPEPTVAALTVTRAEDVLSTQEFPQPTPVATTTAQLAVTILATEPGSAPIPGLTIVVPTSPVSGGRFTVIYRGEDEVNLREGPGLSHAIRTTLPFGSELAVKGSAVLANDGLQWWPVASSDGEGWVAETVGDQRLIKPRILLGQFVEVVNPVGEGLVNLRNEVCEDIATVRRGTELYVLRGPTKHCDPPRSRVSWEGREWWYVSTADGLEGWIADYSQESKNMLIAPSWYVEFSDN